MSITDELREWWVRKFPVMDKELHKDFTAIADRIDAEYEKAEDEWKAKSGQSWLNGYEECRVELIEGNEIITASLEEAGWVKLPLDADGKIIRIGDVMECDKLPNGQRVCGEVKAISNDCVWLINVQYKIHAKYLRHHHEPTVEDVLDEFASAYDRIGGEDEEHQKYLDLIAEYAAKLRLANSEEQ